MFKSFLRTIGIFILSSIAALAAFGLVLALLWALPFGLNTTFKLIALFLATAIAFVSGGWINGKLSKGNPWHGALAWGSLMGLISFGYIFGLSWEVMIGFPSAAGFAVIGNSLAKHANGSNR